MLWVFLLETDGPYQRLLKGRLPLLDPVWLLFGGEGDPITRVSVVIQAPDCRVFVYFRSPKLLAKHIFNVSRHDSVQGFRQWFRIQLSTESSVV